MARKLCGAMPRNTNDFDVFWFRLRQFERKPSSSRGRGTSVQNVCDEGNLEYLFWDVVQTNCIVSPGGASASCPATWINTLGSNTTWTQRHRTLHTTLKCRTRSLMRRPMCSSTCTPTSTKRKKSITHQWRTRNHAKATPIHIHVNSFATKHPSTVRATQWSLRRLPTGDNATTCRGVRCRALCVDSGAASRGVASDDLQLSMSRLDSGLVA